MTTLQVERILFTFPTDWLAQKFDDSSFYRNQFVRQFNGLAAVDLIVVAPNGIAYLIEVKDYRHPDTEKPSELPQAIANKVLMTLAALLPAKLGANNPDEREIAGATLSCQRLRVIAHIELPRAHRQVVSPADLKMKLAQLLRAVDPHVKVASMGNMLGLPWTAA